MENKNYFSGFGGHFSSEALAGALPQNQNSPQKVDFGLYAEQLSGSAFTAPRTENKTSWLYRILPSLKHSKFSLIEKGLLESASPSETPISPNQMRWDPISLLKKASKKIDFVDSLTTVLTAGNTVGLQGLAVHLYAANESMTDRFFYNSDGELLIVPQAGAIVLKTEFGHLEVSPGDIAVIGRGMKFQMVLEEKEALGYVCENYGFPFRLPDLGPIGSNGLANARHFLIPKAKFENKSGNFKLINKFQGNLWEAKIERSPLDVVAWHGNYAPYKYDLKLFNTINTVSFDHCDPSIFTVLTSPSGHPGIANVDFVIFPDRWMVAENTFRPPYYHRNCMSEYMGLIHGVYDAKLASSKTSGFHPGGGSLHNSMAPHGPDAQTFEKASTGELKPVYLKNTLAFMFETRFPFQVTAWAEKNAQKDYLKCWQDLEVNFNQ